MDFGLIYGVLGKTPLYLSVKVSFWPLHAKKSLPFVICLCFKTVSFRGKKSLGLTQIGLLSDEHPRPFHMRVPPPPPPPTQPFITVTLCLNLNIDRKDSSFKEH